MVLHNSFIVTMDVKNISVQPADSRSTTHDGNIKVLKGEANKEGGEGGSRQMMKV